jgi:hydrogenase maturation protein HypF
MELEGLAAGHGRVAPMAGGMVLTANGPDFSPLLAVLLDCDDAAYGAALFHATLAAGLGKWINVAVDREKLTKIAIGGGCAMNRVLMSALAEMLAGSGVTLLEAQQVPANDGGLALGQAWVTRCAWKNGFFENVADHAA